MAEMTERDLFLKLVSNLDEGAACLKGLAQMRKDPRFQGHGLGLLAMREQQLLLYRAQAKSTQASAILLDHNQMAAAGRAAARRAQEREREKKRVVRVK